MKLNDLLLEAAKNTHLEHIEDLVLAKGYNGSKEAINYIMSVVKTLQGHSDQKVRISTKIDGSPALFIGEDPTTKRFFVATKGIFAKEPKQCFSVADIKKFYPDKPEMQRLMTYALKYLSKLNVKGIIQGDLLFTDYMVKEQTVDGETYHMFQPNTIAYAVPAKSELGKHIKAAKIGIVFHTSYTGTELREMTAQFGVDLTQLSEDKNVWMTDPYIHDFTGLVTFTKDESNQIASLIRQSQLLAKGIGRSGFDQLNSRPNLMAMLKTYMNQRVKQNKPIENKNEFLDGFLEYFTTAKLGDVASLQNKKAVEKRMQDVKNMESWINDKSDLIHDLADLYKHLYDAKIYVLGKMANLDKLKSFIETPEGYKVTKPEGFVAIDHFGNAIKLVDRLEFSYNNFAKRM